MEINIVNEYDEKEKILETKFIEFEKYINFLEKENVPIKNLSIEKKINEMIVTIVFVNNEMMQNLNFEFREKNAPTDVLTFCENGENNNLGDIIISVDKIQEQAKEYGHTNKRELFFLITHGFLHLLGYDHQNEIEEKIMFDLQEKLLTNYKIERG